MIHENSYSMMCWKVQEQFYITASIWSLAYDFKRLRCKPIGRSDSAIPCYNAIADSWKKRLEKIALAVRKEVQEVLHLSKIKADCFIIRFTGWRRIAASCNVIILQKLNNIMPDSENERTAIVDLDTVMPGLVLFDLVILIDLVQTTALRTNLIYRANFWFRLIRNYVKGFIEGNKTRHSTEAELKYLPWGALKYYWDSFLDGLYQWGRLLRNDSSRTKLNQNAR